MSISRKYAFGIASLLLLVIFLLSTINNSDRKNTLGVWDAITPKTSPRTTPTPSLYESSPLEVSSLKEDLYPVVKIIDGDTIVVAMGGTNETIRLIGVNTPESVDPRRPVECFGKESSQKASDFLAGRKVQLVVDPSQGDRDKYNRLLRYVFRDDGLFVNKQMIQDGYAYEYTYAIPYQYQSEFREAQQQAQEANVGLWNPLSSCDARVPAETFDDKDCKDFMTQKEAQDFFASTGGPSKDQHKLDSNGDGVVCESLP